MADNLEADYKLRQKVKSAMTYPVVVAGIAVLLVTVMLLFVVPTFAAMFEDLGGDAAAADADPHVPEQRGEIPGAAVHRGLPSGLIVYKRARACRAPTFAYRTDKVKLKIPIFGDLFHKVALSRFTRTLALLLRAGVPGLAGTRHRRRDDG